MECLKRFAWLIAEEETSRVHVAVYTLWSYSSPDFGVGWKDRAGLEAGLYLSGGQGPKRND